MARRRGITLVGSAWIALLALAGQGMADPIFIENAGFEAFELLEDYYSSPMPGGPANRVVTLDPIPGWTVPMATIGTFRPSAVHYPDGIPEGQNVAFIGDIYTPGGAFSQVLTAALSGNTQYTLTAYVGNRTIEPPAIDLEITGYSIQLLAGGTVLAEDNDTLRPPNGDFLMSSVSYLATWDDPLLGEPLEIRFAGAYGGQVNFDDVRLDATNVVPVPAPSALLLAGIGLACSGWTQRRRKT